MDARCRIELLGGLRVLQGGRLITRFSTQKTAALLAYLAYHRQTAHAREVLIELLWHDSSQNAGRASLSMALSSLRHQLEPPGVSAGAVLIADRNNVGLNVLAITTDVAEFETAVEAANRARDDQQRLQHLTDAVEQYRGRLLPGHYEDWALLQQDRLEELYLRVLRRIVSLCQQTGEGDAAISFARRILLVDPLREEAHRDLMRLYAKAGQPEQALRQYQELERLLDQEQGDVPAPETRALVRQIERDRTLLSQPAERSPVAEGKKIPSKTTAAVLPIGTVTFLFTDIEGSTALWEFAGDAFSDALSIHHALLRQIFARFNGHEVNEMGDGFLVAFARSTAALTCAVECQRVLLQQEWSETVGNLPVRMGLFTGEVEIKNGEYHGLALHRASRVLSATGHGGQILCAEATAALVRRDLVPELRLTDLGHYRLRDVAQAEHLYQVDYPEMPRRDFPPLRAEPEVAGNLPLTLTRFFGRVPELARLRDMLQEPQKRLITLTGPGGTGKTRLSLEFGAQQREAFGGAVWFVPLADARDENQIVSALVNLLQLTLRTDMAPLEQVITLLSRQSSLVILDNFEQLVEVGSRIVETLLARVPSLKLIVTSRQRLNVTAEQEFPVPPLPTPNGTDTPARLTLFESVQLFVDRAQTVRPDFQVTVHNAASVAELCDRLEGIPLAIELAASRVQTFTPLQMLAQLENRFVFLVGSRRGVEERHRTLQAALDWSYRLLSPELQRFFAHLSVFRGGWTVDAAEAVCEEPLALDYLTQLHECSLIRTQENGEAMRYQMLETIREYAAGQLQSEEHCALQSRHAACLSALVREASPYWRGPDRVFWLDRLEMETDNLRAALDWYKGDPLRAEAGMQMAAALGWFWDSRTFVREGRTREGRVRLEEMLERADGVSVHTRASTLNTAGWSAWNLHDFPAAQRYFDECLSLLQGSEPDALLVGALIGRGHASLHTGEEDRALSFVEEALTIAKERCDPHTVANCLNALAYVVHHRNDFARARVLYQEALTILREADDRDAVIVTLGNLGIAELDLSDDAAAETRWREALNLSQGAESKLNVIAYLVGFAWLAAARGQARRAAILFGTTCPPDVPSELLRRLPMEQAHFDVFITQVRSALGEEAFSAAWTEGTQMTTEQAVAYALEES